MHTEQDLDERIREFLWVHVMAAPTMRMWLRTDENAMDRQMVGFTETRTPIITKGAQDEARKLIEELSS